MRRTACALLFVVSGAILLPAPAGAGLEPSAGAVVAGAAAPTSPVPPRPFGLDQLRRDAAYLARRPFHLGRKGKLGLLAVAGGAVALYLARDEIRDHVQRHRTEDRTRLVNRARDIFGKGALAPTLALMGYGASFATRNDREKETAFLLLESMAFSTAVAGGGSFVLAAERPESGDSLQLFDTDGRGVSVDVALAASIIPPLRRQYLRVRPADRTGRRLWKRSVLGLLYTGAALTAYQRLDADKHWAPDVYLGLLAGLGVGRALCDSHERSAGAAIALDIGPVRDGVALTLRVELSRRRGADRRP